MSKSSTSKKSIRKSPSKVSAKDKVSKTSQNRPLNKVQEKLLKLFHRPNGATLTETKAAGANYPTRMALRMFEKRGYKTNIVKKVGELTRYIVRR